LDFPLLRPFAVGALIVAGLILVPCGGFLIFLTVMLIRGVALGQIERMRSQNRPAESLPRKSTPGLPAILRARQKIIKIVDQHLETLARRRIALVKVDHYGVVHGTDWNKEVQHFVEKVVRPQLSAEEAEAVAPQMNSVFQELIEDRVATKVDEIEATNNLDEVDNPAAFERWCANELTKIGWHADVTRATGDQGADVVARKGPETIVLQCKLYNSPVGNKAVQEAFSARRHYGMRRAAVVSNSQYTKSARELANTTGVLLLHSSDLGQLDNLLSGSSNRELGHG
jgi:restriction system protein